MASSRHPGGRVVAAVAVQLTCVAGFGFYSLAIYVHELTATGAFDLGTVSRASALYLLVNGLAGVAVAPLLTRWDVRVAMAAGAVCLSLGVLLIGQVGSPAQLYAAYALLGLGQAGIGVVPGSTVIARWFVVRRSTAMALASTGLSVGGIAVAPAVGYALQVQSLAVVTAGAAAVCLVLLLAATAAVVPDPAGTGHAPDGLPGGGPALELDGVLRAQAVRAPAFWSITAAMVLASLAQVGGLTHLFSLVAERGSTGTAGLALSSVAVGSLTGRFIGGLLLRRLTTEAFFRLLLLVQAAALLALVLAPASAAVLLGSSLVFGFTIGNVLLCHPLLLSEAFGLRDFPRLLSLSILVATAGTAAGPVVVGALHDASGYALGYAVAAAGSLAGALVLRAPARRRRAPAPEPVVLLT